MPNFATFLDNDAADKVIFYNNEQPYNKTKLKAGRMFISNAVKVLKSGQHLRSMSSSRCRYSELLNFRLIGFLGKFFHELRGSL